MVSVHGGGLKAPLLVWAMAVAFLLLVASLLIGSFSKPEFPPYEIGLHADSTYTLDASRGDGWQWWRDLGFRRNHVITAHGQFALFEILAYYCREVGSACYTVRYKTTRPRPASSGARK